MEKIDIIRKSAETLTRWSDTVTQYLDTIDGLPEFVLKPGDFYKTINGSVIVVVEPHDVCRCKVCTAKKAIAQQKARKQMMQVWGLVIPEPTEEQIVLAAATEMPADHKENAFYICQVVRGGHGLEGMPGSRVGQAFMLDNRGKLTGDALNCVSVTQTAFDSDLFAMMGMIPKVAVTANFFEE